MTGPGTAAIFADLTSRFEDAAALAAEGQAQGLRDGEIAKIARRLRRIIRTAEAKLDRLSG